MDAVWYSQIDAWRDFYIFVGTAAATLMGLVFVVVSLGKGTMRTEEGRIAARAFYTPVVAFFTTEIAVAMLMLIPKSTPTALGALLFVAGAIGLTYMFVSGVIEGWRSSELATDDLLFYVVLPFLSYLVVIVGAVGVWRAMPFGLYTIAVVMILLLLIGVRNAWDLVIYIAQRGESGTD